jgi:tetratricopeptide (TPR) repeat protein
MTAAAAPPADPYRPLLARASEDLKAGRHAQAEKIYRDILAQTPEHAVAMHYLGICLVQMGRAQEGLDLLARSMGALGDQASYRHNHALALAQAGAHDAAERELEAAIALDPRSVPSYSYLGIIRQQRGRLDAALEAYRAAADLAPDDGFVAANYGNCLLARGEFGPAIEWLRRSVAVAPRNPVAHNNLGSALNASGDLQGAITAYRKAVEVEGRYAPGWFNLGLALRKTGDEEKAIEALRQAVAVGPDFVPAWQAFADGFANARFLAWNSRAAEDVTRTLAHPSIDPAPLAEAAASLLQLDPAFAPAFRELAAAREPAVAWFAPARLRTLAHPTLLTLIENALVPDPGFETFLRALRRSALQAWCEGVLVSSPESLALVCALAQQCFLNEYVWAESNAEAAEIGPLLGAVRTAPRALETALLAAYRPLAAIAGLARASEGGDTFARLWRRQVEEPAEERRLRGTIETLTPVEDEISRAVARQYEENPYPRWHRVPASLATPYPLQRSIREQFAHVAPARLRIPSTPAILVAGCGTGYQTAITALRNPGARILAVDLSRTSLAYAMRRANELGLVQLRFAQADLLGLGSLGEQFDAIECTGVLHHMRDPAQGLRVLVSLLRDGGVMKLALYSDRARAGVVAARALIAQHGVPAGLAGIRAARALVLAQPAESPARTVTLGADFYSASGARDLVLHVQEHRHTLAQLEAMLREVGLEFLGFEFADPAVPAAYQRRFPDDPAASSLANWARFEEENPEVFVGMYQFWALKAATPIARGQ